MLLLSLIVMTRKLSKNWSLPMTTPTRASRFNFYAIKVCPIQSKNKGFGPISPTWRPPQTLFKRAKSRCKDSSKEISNWIWSPPTSKSTSTSLEKWWKGKTENLQRYSWTHCHQPSWPETQMRKHSETTYETQPTKIKTSSSCSWRNKWKPLKLSENLELCVSPVSLIEICGQLLQYILNI